MGCLHDPANVQQTSSKCIQNTRANAGCKLAGSCKHPTRLPAGALNLQDWILKDWILTDQSYKWTCMMTGQESERPTKSQGQQL